MATQAVILRAFISSPGDVKDDRDAVEEVIEELNRSLGASRAVQILPLRWETDVVPGVGAEVQQVINHQTSSQYDIFIGVMWARFGTPTAQFGSGTEEEFTIAYERIRGGDASLQVLFFFKDAPLPPSKLDVQQLARVQNFRAQLGSMGVLSNSYATREEFQRLLRMHFTKIISNWEQKLTTLRSQATKSELAVKVQPQVTCDTEEPDTEVGLFDLLADFQELTEALHAATNRMTSFNKDIGESISKRAEELEQAKTASPTSPNFRQMQRICAAAAKDMDDYVSRMEPEVSIFEATHARSMDCMLRALPLVHLFGNIERRQVDELRTAIEQSVQGLQIMRAGTKSYRDVVARLPRATNDFNRARGKVVRMLDRLIQTIDSATNISSEAGRTVHEILGKVVEVENENHPELAQAIR